MAIALALCAVADWQLAPLELALACQRAELRAVGVPCGISTRRRASSGREGSAVLLDCWTLEHRLVLDPSQTSRCLVVDSGVERRLENTDYAERRAELESALRTLGAERSTLLEVSDLDGLDGVAERRLRHVVAENERVRRFAAAIESGDLPAAGSSCSRVTRAFATTTRSLSPSSISWSRSRRRRAHGARLLGGGFGGSVLVLVDRSRAADVARNVTGE